MLKRAKFFPQRNSGKSLRMSNQKILTVSWTENALENATSIKLYLEENILSVK
jgi:hypothetical protein